MRMLFLAVLALAGSAQARDVLGVYHRWAAFRDAAPLHCFAIARPVERGGGVGAFVSIGAWPGVGVRGQLHIRLSRARRASARVTLSIDDRRFDLIAGVSDAWAPDARTDAAIVAAIRSGRALSVESVSASGRAFADAYTLEGAATAIDAAALGCVTRARALK